MPRRKVAHARPGVRDAEHICQSSPAGDRDQAGVQEPLFGRRQPAASSQSKPTGSGAAEPGLQSLLGRKARLPQTPHTSSRMIQFNFHKVHENKGLRTSRGLLNNPSLVSPHRSLRVFNIHPANQGAFPRGPGESSGHQPCWGLGARKPCELSFGLPGFLSGI